jgi:hypothetical protein
MNTLVNFEISHAVDDSDIAFSMRLDRGSTICSMLNSKGSARHRVSTSLDAFINLPTLNYLLAGLQLCYSPLHPDKSRWFDLLHDLDQRRYPAPQTRLGLGDVRYIVRDLIRPFGVVRGSEKQGGQDETGLASATWPVNFVTNLVLDGKERNIVNVWHNHDISAGDDLVLRLRPMPIPSDRDGGYTLNHYYKRYVQQNFASYMQVGLAHPRATHVWQLVPDIFDLEFKPENDHVHGSYEGPGLQREPLPHVIMSPGFEVPLDYTWQEHGFWHIGRSQVMVRRFASREYYFNDMANNLKINHLDMTFEPTWTKVPGEERSPGNPRTARDPAAPDTGLDRERVYPGMMGAEVGGGGGGGGGKRVRWAPQLQLEQFLREPMPEFGACVAPGQQRAHGGLDALGGLFAPPLRAGGYDGLPGRPGAGGYHDPLARMLEVSRPMPSADLGMPPPPPPIRPARPAPPAEDDMDAGGGSGGGLLPFRDAASPPPHPHAAAAEAEPAARPQGLGALFAAAAGGRGGVGKGGGGKKKAATGAGAAAGDP